MSLWLNLIPQLHQPGLEELNMRHHHFQEEGAQYYDGSVRPQSLQRPSMATPPPTTTTSTTSTTTTTVAPAAASSGNRNAECPPNATGGRAHQPDPTTNSNSLLRKLASSHYQSYTTALTVTIAVGCFLLLLNILIFAGIYHQRDRRSSGKKCKKKEELGEAMMVELQEFKSSPGSGSSSRCAVYPPPGYSVQEAVTSPSIPEPPPPPKAQPPQQGGCPQTPSSMKKRVQIQEISV
ncbi:hypothetical protein AAG570_001777 [Ranatra chinensis]|uniref:Uncharacterized protein n=1 Tax=Ranatra chinensis TaxID=642074 RepID=A0ABD0Y9S8_9HEMI